MTRFHSLGLIHFGLMIEEIPTLLEGCCEKIRKQSCCHMITIAVSCFYPLTCQVWRENCYGGKLLLLPSSSQVFYR